MISGKAFMKECKWSYDPRYPVTFSFPAARSGDMVFLNGDYVHQFASGLNRFPRKYFTFVVHNSDQRFDQQKLDTLLPFAQHIYSINTTVTHPKLTTIPLGFPDRDLEWLATYEPSNVDRTIPVYLNFTTKNNHSARSVCFDAFPDAVHDTPDLNRPDYYRRLESAHFVPCPEGTGMDTHRFYEALYCGATPVVLRSCPLIRFYEQFPCCIVDSWTDPLVAPPRKPVSFSVHHYLQ